MVDCTHERTWFRAIKFEQNNAGEKLLRQRVPKDEAACLTRLAALPINSRVRSTIWTIYGCNRNVEELPSSNIEIIYIVCQRKINIFHIHCMIETTYNIYFNYIHI